MSLNRLEDLAQLAEDCRETFLAVAADSHWKPAPRSAASQAQRLAASQDPASTSVDHMADFDLVSEVLVTYLEVAAGHLAFRAVAVVTNGAAPGTPCGICRQVLAEFGNDLDVLCFTPDGIELHYRLSDLLPHAFTLK